MQKNIRVIIRKVLEPFYGRGIGKFYPLNKVAIFLSSYLREPGGFVEVYSHKMFLDPLDTLGLSVRPYEPQVVQVFSENVKEGDVVLDIGANIGYYTLICARLVGDTGRVFAFEPDPINFALLKRNVEINSYDNVNVIDKAVSNITQKTKLYLSETNLGRHRIYDTHDNRKSVEIQAIRLDDYFKGYDGKIDFVKLDIEGAEAAAIQGMSNLLEKNKNIKIVTEFLPSGQKGFGIEPEEYLNLLVKLGFSLYNIDKDKRKVAQVGIPELLEIYTPEKENYTNLLCVRGK